jgi:hypothetical protein
VRVFDKPKMGERERESHTHNRRSIQTPLKCEPNCSLIGSKKRAQPQIRAANHATTCRFDAPPRLQSKNVMDIGNPKVQTRKEWLSSFPASLRPPRALLRDTGQLAFPCRTRPRPDPLLFSLCSWAWVARLFRPIISYFQIFEKNI